MGTKAHSLAHTKWLCKYHIVFTPKYRRKIIFAQLRESIKEILQCLCKYKGVEILEGHLMPDHVHMLVSIPPKISVANFMGYLKGKRRVLHKECYNDILQLRSSLCNTVQNVRQSGL